MSKDVHKSLQGTLTPRAGWTIAFVWAVGLAVFFATYVFFLDGSLMSLLSLSKVAAGTATFLFAASLGMGSFSYYFGVPDLRRGYQKYIGILAFYVAALYSAMLMFTNLEYYFFGFFKNFFTADIALGFVAMAIFGSMVMVNTKYVRPFVGIETIKFVFGLGYVAYALLVIRAIWIEWDMWAFWFEALEGLPPPRILLSIVATTVLTMRVSVPLHKKLRGSEK